jgi:transposase
MRKSFKFELKFNESQIILAAQTAGSCRFIWNEWLAIKKEKREKNKEKISRYYLILF